MIKTSTTTAKHKAKTIRSKVKIAMSDGSFKMYDGYLVPDVPGLCIHKNDNAYKIDHRPSGYQAVPEYASKRLFQAVELIVELGRLAEQHGFQWDSIPLDLLRVRRDLANEVIALRDMVAGKYARTS